MEESFLIIELVETDADENEDAEDDGKLITELVWILDWWLWCGGRKDNECDWFDGQSNDIKLSNTSYDMKW